MTAEAEKSGTPPYVSYSSFKSFIKGLGESVVPDRIDKTSMANYSGSVVYALLPALAWLGLIDEEGTPSDLLRKLAVANDTDFPGLLAPLVKSRYSFLFNGKLNLTSASSGQVIEAFKAQDINGSTVTKCMAFFLAIAKDASIPVSPHVKAPVVPRAAGSKVKKKAKPDDDDDDDDGADPGAKSMPEATDPSMRKITVPLPGLKDGAIYFPAEMTKEQAQLAVKMADFILKNYYGISGG